jgi:asparagine synthase (glutamine-hydrolysing)
MCGIAGVVRYPDCGREEGADAALVRSMCALIEHRGPDEEGYYCQGPATLGVRRLSIIDVAGGHQPVTNEDGTVWAVFNGEIYNFRQLRSELMASGHVFTSRSDTETIVHAYEAYGDNFPARLDGMFSIALWDAHRGRLVLVRDRFGKKPLFYAQLPSGLAFGSELKCLLSHPEFERTINPLALDEYLSFGYVPAPGSIFKMARKVLPANILTYEAGQVRTECYWTLPPRNAVGQLSPERWDEARSRLEALLEEAVAKRLVSDVPLGAFLSGGLDSSVVVALMARLTRERVKTFTIGFDQQRFNEAPAARLTAEVLGTEHHELIIRPDVNAVLPTIIWGMDEPQADSSVIPTYYVSQLARQHVTVCLTGDGGDEAFAGYARYGQAIAEQMFDQLPTSLRRISNRLAVMLPEGTRGKGRLTRIGSHPVSRYVSEMTLFGTQHRAALYEPAWRQQLADVHPQSHLEALFSRHQHSDLLSAMQWVDIQSYLTGDILAKVDRMSMVNSLETRAPLLDHRLVEFAFSLPVSAFHEGGVSKRLFRDVVRRLLPAELLHRPKTGFGIPRDDWLRGPLKKLVRETLLGDGLASRGWFRGAQLQQLIDDHDLRLIRHGSRLWTLLCLELWARQFLDGPREHLISPPRRSVGSIDIEDAIRT